MKHRGTVEAVEAVIAPTGTFSSSVTVSGMPVLTGTPAGVDDVNSVPGSVVISGAGIVDVSTEDQVITVSGGSPAPAKISFVYESAGGQVVSGATTYITFNTVSPVSDADAFDLNPGTSELTFLVSGTYEVSYNVSLYDNSTPITNGTRSQAQCWMERDTGGGWTLEFATADIFYIRGATHGTSGSATIIQEYDVGDKIRIAAQRFSGSSTIKVLPNGASITAKNVRADGPQGVQGIQGEPGDAVQQLDLHIPEPTAGDSVAIRGYAFYPFTIDSMWSETEVAAVTLTLAINGTDVGGLGHVGVTPVGAVTSASSLNSVATGDKVEVTVSGADVSAAGLTVALKTTRGS